MSDTFNSVEWYRISGARPKLRRDAVIRRHLYLGRPWYVISDATGGKVHRLTPAAYQIAGRLDGATTLDTIWREAVAAHGEDAPGQDEIVRLVSQLHNADLLSGDDRPMLDDLLDRRDKDRLQAVKKLLLNPLSVTIPLFDPNRLLGFLARAAGLFPRGFWWLLAAAVVLPVLILLPSSLPALTDRGLEGFIDMENLALLAFIYPVVKAFHEIGHGVSVRARGGEVHETGLIFIAFYPIPYVEASASLTFPSKWDRAAVAAAGVAVEIVIAAIAFHVWLVVEPGLVRTIAFNTMVISGLSTLVVNGNPLMKFDGYHVLSDLIEIPNLSKRGNDWWGEWLRIRVLGTRERMRMVTTGWERFWFVFYPPLAFVYRIAITFSIALYVAGTYRAIGIALAAWSLVISLLWPFLKTMRKLFQDNRIAQAGGRAVAGGGIAVAALAALLFVPAPFHAMTQGVVWLPPEAIIRAEAAGQIREIYVADGQAVTAGTPLFRLSAPELEAEADRRASRLAQLRVQYASARFADRSQANRLKAAVEDAERALDDARARIGELTIGAGVDGRVDMPAIGDSLGRFLREGEVAGYVLPSSERLVRVVVRQSDVDLVRNRLREVRLRIADQPGEVVVGRIVREVPAGTAVLPSAVLSLDGGGPFATVPTERERLKTVDRLFQFDVAIEAKDERSLPYGMRAFVRFDLEPMPVAFQVARSVRATFLTLFGA